MKSKLYQLRKKAQAIVDNDPQLRKIQDSFKALGLSDAESLAATLGRKFSEHNGTVKKPTEVARMKTASRSILTPMSRRQKPERSSYGQPQPRES